MSLITPVGGLPEQMAASLPDIPPASTGEPLNADEPALRHAKLRETAEEFEIVFLTEMLAHAGLGESRENFGGGAGEDAFGGMLVAEQARIMVEKGGVGIAEHIFQALLAREPGNA